MLVVLVFNTHSVIYKILLSKTIDILHNSNFIMLKIYEVLILNNVKSVEPKYPFIPIITIHVFHSYYTFLWHHPFWYIVLIPPKTGLLLPTGDAITS